MAARICQYSYLKSSIYLSVLISLVPLQHLWRNRVSSHPPRVQ